MPREALELQTKVLGVVQALLLVNSEEEVVVAQGKWVAQEQQLLAVTVVMELPPRSLVHLSPVAAVAAVVLGFLELTAEPVAQAAAEREAM